MTPERPDRPPTALNGCRTLVGAAELAAALGAPGLVVVDCRFTLGDPESGIGRFVAGHIPGARYAHLERELGGPRTPRSGRNPLPDPASFALTLGRLGITPESQVVVCDDSFGSIAARLWWMLRWIGHPRVALLDGGWPAWKRRKFPVETGTPAVVNPAPPYPVHPDPGGMVDAAIVGSIRSDAGWRLLDARPEDRFSGERETVDPVAGHIPGSRLHCFEDNLGAGGEFLPVDELRAVLLAVLDGVPADRTVHTCGSGVTACHNLLAMEHAGLPGSRLYPGSWSEWIGDPARPVATGPD